MENIILEACVGSFYEAQNAMKLGASRIELCDNLAEGGTTPSYGTILYCKEKLNIPSAVMIRPRGGNFVYSDEEINIMKLDIEICKKIGVESVVFGILTKENIIDEEKMEELIRISRPLKVVFHMAFDEIEDFQNAIKILMKLNIDRLLTKGSKINAFEGKQRTKILIELTKGKIDIVIGGGVNKDNYSELAEFTKGKQFHGTKIVGMLK